MSVQEISKVELEYAKEFWKIGNAVTAFSIVQMIAYLLAVGPSDGKIRADVAGAAGFVVLLIVLATIFYAAVVVALTCFQHRLLKRSGSSMGTMLAWVAVGQALAIGGFGVLGWYVTTHLGK